MKADYFWKPLFLILFLVSFFHLTIIPYSVWERNGRMLFLIPVLILIFAKGKLTKASFIEPRLIQWYFILIFINCLTCLYFREQSIWVSLQGWQPFLFLLFLPVFNSWKLPIDKWEKILYAVFYIILIGYILQNIFIDFYIFKLDKYRGFLLQENRVRIFSDGFLYLGGLLCWNKYVIDGKKKNLFCFLLTIFIVFLQGYRTLIIFYLLSCLFIYVKIKGLKKTVVFSSLSMILFLGFLQDVSFIREKIEEMQSRTETASFSNESYVRYLDIEYTYSTHFINPVELIMGSGMPKLSVSTDDETGERSIGKSLSTYSNYMNELAAYNHYYTVDLGILGLSWVAGIPFAMIFIVILLSQFIKMVNNNTYLYLGTYCLFVLLSGFTNAISYKHSNILLIAIIIVMIECARNEISNSNSNKVQ